MPWRMAPAWPVTPPPSTLTIVLNRPSVPVTRNGIRTSALVDGVAEVLVHGPAVDDDLAFTGQQSDASHGRLAAAGPVVERGGRHVGRFLRQASGSGRWA